IDRGNLLNWKWLLRPACVASHTSPATRPASNKLTRWLDRKVWSIGVGGGLHDSCKEGCVEYGGFAMGSRAVERHARCSAQQRGPLRQSNSNRSHSTAFRQEAVL